jgi:hypothetical protein
MSVVIIFVLTRLTWLAVYKYCDENSVSKNVFFYRNDKVVNIWRKSLLWKKLVSAVWEAGYRSDNTPRSFSGEYQLRIMVDNGSRLWVFSVVQSQRRMQENCLKMGSERFNCKS